MRLGGVAIGVVCAWGCGGGGGDDGMEQTRELVIELRGTATGTVTSDPPGIACGTACRLSVPPGTTVTLSASPAVASVFAGWDGGGCSGPAGCAVTVQDDVTIGATFDDKLEAFVLGPMNRDVDVLFVVDNSHTMQEEQQSLQANFPRFIQALQAEWGELPNLHIGVITSDVGTLDVNTGDAACDATGGDHGNLQTNGCASLSGNYISDINDPVTGHIVNYSGALADVFSCIANVGDTGCGFEQHLESMKRALDNNPVNAGFVRPAAMLGVIIIADEDDCSAHNAQFFGPESTELGPMDSFRCFEKGVVCDQGSDIALRDVGVKTGCHANTASAYLEDPAVYLDFLRTVKPDPHLLAVVSIIGNHTPVEVSRRVPMGGGAERPDLLPSCMYTDVETGLTNDADPGIRLAELAAAVPRSAVSTICADDLSPGLMAAAQLFNPTLMCVEGELYDVDAGAAGLQPECSFMGDIVGPLPLCDRPTNPTNAPCVAIAQDPTRCPASATHVAVSYVGPAQAVSGNCLVY